MTLSIQDNLHLRAVNGRQTAEVTEQLSRFYKSAHWWWIPQEWHITNRKSFWMLDIQQMSCITSIPIHMQQCSQRGWFNIHKKLNIQCLTFAISERWMSNCTSWDTHKFSRIPKPPQKFQVPEGWYEVSSILRTHKFRCHHTKVSHLQFVTCCTGYCII